MRTARRPLREDVNACLSADGNARLSCLAAIAHPWLENRDWFEATYRSAHARGCSHPDLWPIEFRLSVLPLERVVGKHSTKVSQLSTARLGIVNSAREVIKINPLRWRQNHAETNDGHAATRTDKATW